MIEILKQALDALYPISHNSTDDYRGCADKAISFLLKAIAELESQEQWGASAVMNPDYIAEQQKKTKQIRAMLESKEPVAWMCSAFDGEPCEQSHHDECENPIPLYTHPPQRKPLTDDQIYEMYSEPRSDAEMLAFARAIEAAHGIKEQS